MSRPVSERAVVLLIGAVQFVNVLDFVMVMPLGPDFAQALGISRAHLGYVGGSYTAAAALAGLLGSFFLDRFDRRKALAVCLAGLAVGTVAGGLAGGLWALLAARLVAGAFGGPATSLAFSIIADTVPPERRGRAMGAVMSAFSLASILGVPAGLELARQGGWRLPFFLVGGMGLLVALLALRLLPPLSGHRGQGGGRAPPGLGRLLARPEVRLSYSLTAVVMVAGFLVIPNVPAYVQGNLGLPRAALGLMYLLGGGVSLLTLRTAGRLVDRFGSFRVGLAGACALLLVLGVGFLHLDWLTGGRSGLVPVLLVFMGFMLALGTRNVAYNTLTSKVPRGPERARFMSLQSAVQHLSSAAGAFCSSLLLSEGDAGALQGMGRVVGASMALTLLAPLLMGVLERRVGLPAAGGAGEGGACPEPALGARGGTTGHAPGPPTR